MFISSCVLCYHHISDYAIYRAADGSCEGDGGVQVWPDEDVQAQAKLQDAHVWKCGCDGEAKNGWIFTHESTVIAIS